MTDSQSPRRQHGIWGALMAVALIVPGCGVSYHSPSVSAMGAGAEVRVIELNAESVILANRAPYAPRSLPQAFVQSAGAVSEPRASSPARLRPPPPAVPAPYRLGAGDVIALSLPPQVGAAALPGAAGMRESRHMIRDNGAVTIPELGPVPLAGLTLDEAEASLFQMFLKKQKDPAFSLDVAEFNAHSVSVGGAVGAAAMVPVTLRPLSLEEALTRAGGPQGKDAVIRIQRDAQTYQIPLTDYRRTADLRQMRLSPGDAIFVEDPSGGAATDAAFSRAIQGVGQRRAALDEVRGNFQAREELGATPRDHVYLSGEVANQRRYALPYDQVASLADVLFDSGGFKTATGDPAQIYVLRAASDPADHGAVTAWHLDARNAANLTLAANMKMRPNDIVFIEEQPITKWSRALQQMFPVLIATAAGAGG